MLVNWKGSDGALVVPLIDVTKAQDGTQALNHDQVVLVPGWNDVKAEHFTLMLPHIRDLIDSDRLEFYAKKDKVEEEYEVTEEVNGKMVTKKEIRSIDKYVDQDLRDIRADKAREIVKGCFRVPNLEAWLEDARLSSEIRNLVDMQLEKIKNYRGDEDLVRM